MAGLGFKDFQVGEVLTSSDVDGYLMQQTVMRFADAAARGSALGTAVGTAVPLAEGMVTYLDDSNMIAVYTGSVWESVPPAGMVGMFGGTAAPDGWLKANGAEVSRVTYSRLFAAIGTAFGSGDGSTTFDLPDLRGEFVRGWDDARGVDSGRVIGSSQAQSTNNVSEFQTYGSGSGSTYQTRTVPDDGSYSSGSVTSNDGAEIPTGSGGISIRMKTSNAETRPRNVALLACIKF